MNKELVTITIAKHRKQPEVIVTLNNELTEVKMPMAEFERVLQVELQEAVEEMVTALAPEILKSIGNIKWKFNENAFREQVTATMKTVASSVAVSKAVSDIISEIELSAKKAVKPYIILMNK